MSFQSDTIMFKRMSEEYDKVKIKCKCGHRVVVPMWVDKKICSWCGKYVYRNKKEEFKDKVKQKIKEKR